MLLQEDYKEIFDFYCSNQSRLNYNELETALLSVGITLSTEEKVEKEKEYSKENRIALRGWSLNEFISLCNEHFNKRQSEQEIVLLFEKYDPEKKGYILMEKIESIFNGMEKKIPKKELNKILLAIDFNNDGKIYYKQLAHQLMI